ncbi:hypothetical protein [Mucilaginibacter ginsenosidivorax]|uniref:Uncharacterized protein n=1 Tax=Mucilaginibacter ginsenosidivorax TaxID=862126 RepID=A0A5B8VV84_9SPHI|nr:hypothetical protein [Mucilaginibacter ginsenosidivorax]QEC75041.1 hypothetical protein FSB76_03405 [Mucilaginibacter ginsenosidivorax]
MENPEKNTESFIHTVIRTIITTTIIAAILYWVHVFPSGGKSKLVLFEMIWSVVFCIVFGGHWLELLFINGVKFSLPKNIISLYLIRIVYWFVCAVPLFFAANLITGLFSPKTVQMGRWWMFGFFYIGIQLLMHAIMQVRFKKSFYNGVY